MAQRTYRPGDVNSLFAWSGGLCYYPECKTPVTQEIDGEMVSQVEIAHIHALHKKGSRFVDDMTDEQRNSHRNLILLCIPHHKIVDRKSSEAKFPATLLFRWKREREGNKLDALRGLEGLTEEKFEQMLIASVTSAKDELMEAIDALPDRIDDRIVKTLKQLVDQSFQQPRLDEDAIRTLSDAAGILSSMDFSDNVPLLREAAEIFKDVDFNYLMFRLENSGLDKLPETVSELERHTNSITNWSPPRQSGPIARDWRTVRTRNDRHRPETTGAKWAAVFVISVVVIAVVGWWVATLTS